MKKLVSFLLAALMLFSLAACSSDDAPTSTAPEGNTPAGTQESTAPEGGDSEQGVVYGIYKAGDQTWFIDEGAAAQAAVEARGDRFIFVDAKMSPEEYLKAIDNAIANNAKGIVKIGRAHV